MQRTDPAQAPLDNRSLNLRFGPLAYALAGASLKILWAKQGERTYTDGEAIYISTRADVDIHVEIAVQAALLAGGALERRRVARLIGSAERTRRYLWLEAARLLGQASPLLRLIVEGKLTVRAPLSADADESLRRSADKTLAFADEPLLGALRPTRLLSKAPMPRGDARPEDLRRPPSAQPEDAPELEDDEEADDIPGVLKMLATPLSGANPFARFFHQALGSRRAPGSGAPGAEIPTLSMRRSRAAQPQGVRAHFNLENDKTDGVTHLLSRWTYPEWDFQKQAYRQDWCAIHEIPFARTLDRADRRLFSRDLLLTAALRRLALGMNRARRQPEGDDVDLDAVVDFAARRESARRRNLPEDDRAAIFTQNVRTRRDLAALIMVDVSGSVAEKTQRGKCVLDDQLSAAAALTDAFTRAGDRTKVLAFHSRGRDSGRIIVLKPFEQPHAEAAISGLLSLTPSGYTRLGLGLRHCTDRLIREAGVKRRLLIVLSDGVPFDLDYSGRYATEDVKRALLEAECKDIRVLWLCFGVMEPTLQTYLQQGAHELLIAEDYGAARPKLARAIERCVMRAGGFKARAAKTNLANRRTA